MKLINERVTQTKNNFNDKLNVRKYQLLDSLL